MKNEIIVGKMIDYINKILGYVGDCSRKEFSENEMLIEACVFNLSQLGELTSKLDDDYKNETDFVPWKKIYGLRNRIVHDYEGVNVLLIWDIVNIDLPDLLSKLKSFKYQ